MFKELQKKIHSCKREDRKWAAASDYLADSQMEALVRDKYVRVVRELASNGRAVCNVNIASRLLRHKDIEVRRCVAANPYITQPSVDKLIESESNMSVLAHLLSNEEISISRKASILQGLIKRGLKPKKLC